MGKGFLQLSRQIELLRPAQIRETLAQRSLIYLPLGTIEWHCEHLPVGLDALTAHGICLRAAERSGGLVWPPLYYGTGGDHGAYPWTVMMPGADALEALLDHTLTRLADMKVETVVLFSGHFADEQLDMIDRMAKAWAAGKHHPMKVRAEAVNRFDIADFPPDHAGLFETTLLAGLWPATIDLGTLPPAKAEDERLDRHDPKHPIWGVIGSDPRRADLDQGDWLVNRISDQLAAKLA
jgi:creatinine amidohydrolase